MKISNNLSILDTREQRRLYICLFLSLFVAILNLLQLQVLNKYIISAEIDFHGLFISLIVFIVFNALLVLNNYYLYLSANWISSSMASRIATTVFATNPKIYRLNKKLNSEVISTAVLETTYYRLNYIRPLCDLIVSIGIVISTLTFLIINFQFLVLILLLFILLSCFIYLNKSKKITSKLGDLRAKGNALRTDVLARLGNYQGEYYQKNHTLYQLNMFDKFSKKVALSQSIQGILNFSLKPFVEVAFIAGIAILYLASKSLEIDMINSSILILAGYKVLPEFSKIAQSANKLRFSNASYQKIYKQLYARQKAELSNKPCLITSSYSIKRGSVSISMDMFNPKLFLINGPSGSGKSTFLENCIYNNTDPYVYRSIDGVQIDNSCYLDTNQFSYNSQNAKILKADKLSLLNVNNLESLVDLLDNFNLSRLIGLVESSEREFMSARLSGGEEQRLQLISILHGTIKPLIFLDEPTSGLDEQNKINAWTILKRLSRKNNVIVVSHDACARKFSDEVITIK